MDIVVLEDANAVATRVAGIIEAELRARPAMVLGLATGETMAPIYKELVRRHRETGLSFANATTFNLDEYVGLSSSHASSYHRAMRDALFGHVDLRPERALLPDGAAPDPEAEADRYDRLISKAGGIDLQLLGLGRNGHIGFNEPFSSFTSRSRVVALHPDTRAANRRYFSSSDEMPRAAITMGVATILEARACLLVATGKPKAEVVARMIEGPIRSDCPASALRTHPQVTVVLDRPAASGLSAACSDEAMMADVCDQKLGP